MAFKVIPNDVRCTQLKKIWRWKSVVLIAGFILLCLQLFKVSALYSEGQLAPDQAELVFTLILCEGESKSGSSYVRLASSIDRQIAQTEVLIKSSLALSHSRLRYLIVSDSRELYDRVLNSTRRWPPQYLSRLVTQYVPVWYPEERSNMRNMFRVCASELLFLPHSMQEEDAVIYLDTDIIFMTPPENLWNHFYKFDSNQVAAMAPCLFHYDKLKPHEKIPFYGKTGLNTGVVMMNLTRMKDFPDGGWIEANMKAYDKHKDIIVLADQDILNIVFSKFPDKLLELSCTWNYRPFQCSTGINRCPESSTDGVSIIHGNALAFASDNERSFKTVLEAWQAYELGSSLENLYSKMLRELRQVNIHKSECKKLKNIDTVLTKQLQTHIVSNHVNNYPN